MSKYLDANTGHVITLWAFSSEKKRQEILNNPGRYSEMIEE
jgi:hypothetical protein